MSLPPNSRRAFLRTSLGLGAGVVLGIGCDEPAPPAAPAAAPALPPAPAPEPPADELLGLKLERFTLHSRTPITLEARRSSFGVAPLTPTDRFFVRNNLPMPDASILDAPDRWVLRVEGVGSPRDVTLAELKQLGLETVATVVQCSGNGRSFYNHGPSGSQWSVGAAGCAMWAGVRVSTLVEALGGVASAARYMTSTGGDPLPEGVNPEDVIVERSIPVEKGLEDCLLAWEMNGEPIPLTHGGPLRLIVPGYYGCNQIKYIRQLAFTAEQTRAKIQRSGYRLRPIGEKGNPSQPSMWQMNVKSWVNGPGADGQPVLAGKIRFYGVAFSGGSPIASVECSVDGGKSWRPAELIGPDMGAYAWRTFSFRAELPPGSHTIFSRARDRDGAVQPEQRVENERGYGNNSWRDMGLAVSVVETLPDAVPAAAGAAGSPAPAASAAPVSRVELDEQGAAGRALVLEQASPPCGACHTLGDAGTSGVVGPNLDELGPDAARVRAALQNGVGVMPSYKDLLSEEQIAAIAHYVELATKNP